MSFRVLNPYSEMSQCPCVRSLLSANGTVTKMCTASKGARLSFELRTRRALGVLKAYLFFAADGGDESYTEGVWTGLEDGYDVYSFDVSYTPDRGLYFYGYQLHTPSGIWYVTEDGWKCRDKVCTDRVLVYDEEYEVPDWLAGGIIYHIFVDRFYKGSKEVAVRDDAVLYTDWENGVPEYPEYPGAFLRNNTFFGGTLWGVAEKLDYLKGLGVSCIYLSPVFKAYSNHKYDTGDYMQVDEMFGGDEALKHLIDRAAEKGMGVILDGVFNHVGDDSLYFDHFGKYGGKGAFYGEDSPYYDWFSFIDYPDKYEAWWGIGNLPKVNRTKSFRKLIYGKGGVVDKYMGMGAAGFRLDVVDELEGDFTEGLSAAVKKHKSDAYMVGEVWEDASDKIAYGERKRYFQGAQLDAVMNYPLRNGLIEYALYKNAPSLAHTVWTLYRHYPPHKMAYMMNIIGTHDTERILTVLGGDRAEDCSNADKAKKRMSAAERRMAKKRLKMTALLQMTLPGIPCVYYGDEVGMEGYKDPFNRRPFPWHKADEELCDWYRRLGAVRGKEPLLAADGLRIVKAQGGVFVFERYSGTDRLLVLSNVDDTDECFDLEGTWVSLLSGKRYKNTYILKSFKGDILRLSK